MTKNSQTDPQPASHGGARPRTVGRGGGSYRSSGLAARRALWLVRPVARRKLSLVRPGGERERHRRLAREERSTRPDGGRIGGRDGGGGGPRSRTVGRRQLAQALVWGLRG